MKREEKEDQWARITEIVQNVSYKIQPQKYFSHLSVNCEHQIVEIQNHHSIYSYIYPAFGFCLLFKFSIIQYNIGM